MPIFKCKQCGCVENTALCNYWVKAKDDPPLCSECDPKIAGWHGLFEKVLVDSETHYVEDRHGFLV